MKSWQIAVAVVSNMVVGIAAGYAVPKAPVIVTQTNTIERIVEVKSLEAYDAYSSEVLCLAANIYHEARGEGIEGQIAVANTTVNRTNIKRFPSSVCGVVHQKNQFSWVADKPYIDLNDPLEMKAYQKALYLALDVMNGKVEDITKGADHYYNPHKVSPKWAEKITEIAMIGNHRFMKE